MKLKTKLWAVVLLGFSCAQSQNLVDSKNIIDGHNHESKEAVLQRAHTKLEGLLAKYPFPEKHVENVIQPYYENYELNRNIVKKLTEANSLTQIEKLDSLEEKYKLWRYDQVEYVNNINNQWKKLVKRYDFDDQLKKTFIDYHFYKNYTLDDTYENVDFEKLKSNTTLNLFAKILAKAETDYVFETCTFDELDSVRLNYGYQKLHKRIDSILFLKLKNDKDVFLKRNTSARCKFVKNSIKAVEEKISSRKKDHEDSLFVAKAKSIGLDDAKIAHIQDLIVTRNTALKERAAKLKESEGSMSELFDNTAVRSKSEIKKEFSKNLAETIDRKQFKKLFGNLFTKNVKKNGRATLENLYANYEFTDEQKIEVGNLVLNYHENEEVFKAYYFYDKKLKKQKLTSLNYAFKKMMEEFNISFETAPNIRKKYTWE